MIYLKLKGIATACHYTSLSQQPLFKPYAKNCSFIEKEANKFITLPLHADLTNVEIEYMINELKTFETKIIGSLNKLPENLTIDQIIDHLIFIEKVQKGLDDSANGLVNTKEETKA